MGFLNLAFVLDFGGLGKSLLDKFPSLKEGETIIHLLGNLGQSNAALLSDIRSNAVNDFH